MAIALKSEVLAKPHRSTPYEFHHQSAISLQYRRNRRAPAHQDRRGDAGSRTRNLGVRTSVTFAIALTTILTSAAQETTAQTSYNAADKATLASYYSLEDYGSRLPGKLGNLVTIEGTNVPVEVLLRRIGQQSTLSIVFDTDLVASLPAQSLNLNRVAAATAVLQVIADTGLRALVTPDWRILVVPTAGPPSSVPSVAQATRSQTVRGVVLDRTTGGPLPGASVVVLDTEPLLGTISDGEGNFSIRNVPIGRHDIEARFLGYGAVRKTSVFVGSSKEVVLTFEMTEQVLTGEDIIVTPDIQKDLPINELAAVSVRPFTVEETRRYAGGVDDPARIASAFAGVTTTGDIADNALIIRGNAPKGVSWRLEGVDIPNPTHFAGLNVAGGGGVTIFSSQLLDDSDFLTGAFPAEYGNALAGVFDMHMRRGNSESREHTFQIGLLGVDLATEGPFTARSNASYLINYRYSTLGLLMPLIPASGLPIYQDLSFKTSFPIARTGRLDFWGIGGLDRQKQDALENIADWQYRSDRTRVRLDLGMGAMGATYRHIVGPQTYMTASLAATGQRTTYRDWLVRPDGEFVPQVDLNNLNTSVTGSVTLNHKLSASSALRTGLSARNLRFDNSVSAAAHDSSALIGIATEDGSTWLSRAFAQVRFGLGASTTMDIGLHAQQFVLTDEISLEPRVAIQQKLSVRHTLKLAYGLHSQVEDVRFYFLMPYEEGNDPVPAVGILPNIDLAMTKAHHAVIGHDWHVGELMRVKLEGYYQYLFDVPVISDSSYSLINFTQDFELAEELSNSGAGKNYGIEATVERFLGNDYYFLVTGSVFESRYRGGDGIWRDTRYDQRFAANALGGREFVTAKGNVVGVNGRLTIFGGSRRSPVDLIASAAQHDVVLDETNLFSIKDPSRAIADVTITYRRNRQKTASIWALQVKNVLASSSRYFEYDYSNDRVAELKDTVVLPVLSYKIEF